MDLIPQQEAFEKCWAHSRLRAASRPFSRCRYRYCRAPPAHRCPRRQRQRRQRQRVTEGTTMAPWNGPNEIMQKYKPRLCASRFTRSWPHNRESRFALVTENQTIRLS